MTRSSLHHAYLLKGWLLDKQPPEAVTEALGAIIAELEAITATLDGSCTAALIPTAKMLAEAKAVAASIVGYAEAPATASAAADPSPSANISQPVEEPDPGEPAVSATEPTPAKQKRSWSPEARAAAAERMRAMQAAKRAKGSEMATAIEYVAGDNTSPTPANHVATEPPHRLTVAHAGYAGRRDPGQALTDADWPDIKARLDKSPDRRAIAGDYDVDLDDLNYFIQSCQRREQRAGEALAPRHHGA